MKNRFRRSGSNNNISEAAAALGIFAAFGTVMYFKGRLLPKYADDYPYSFIWDGKHHGNLTFGKKDYKRVRNFKDLVKSQISHYRTWDGRTIAESLVQIFLMSDDKKHFDRANTAAMLAQLAICGKLGKGRKYTSILTIPTALTLTAGFWTGAPNIMGSCFWLTGSMNYLWQGLSQTSFLLPYSFNYHDSKYSANPALMGLLGLLAGWSTETGAGAALMLSSLAVARKIIRRETVAPWMISGLAGIVSGLILLLIAPGNRVKFQYESEYSDTLPMNMDDRLPGYVPAHMLYTPEMFKAFFKEGFLPTVLKELPLQIPVALYFIQNKNRYPQTTLYLMALEATALAIPSVMMLSPEYPRRATYPSILYVLAAAVRSCDMIRFDEIPIPKKLPYIIAGILGVNLLASLLVDAEITCSIADEVLEIKKHGRDDDVTVPVPHLPPVYSFLALDNSISWDICMGVGLDNTEDPYNMAAAEYYGVKSIFVEDTKSPYDPDSLRSVILGLTHPVRSFIRRIKELIKGTNVV